MISFPLDENFDFTDADWQRIAEAAGLHVADFGKRYTLEATVEGWLRDKTPDQMRVNRAQIDKVLDACRHLLDVTRETGVDLTPPMSDLKISELLEPLIDEWESMDEMGPRYQGRKPLQDDLCVLWRMEWGLRLAASTDPVTQEAGGPLVRFLMTVHDIVVEEDLSSHQARYAIRKYRERFAGVSDEELAAFLDEGSQALDDLVLSSKGNGELNG